MHTIDRGAERRSRLWAPIALFLVAVMAIAMIVTLPQAANAATIDNAIKTVDVQGDPQVGQDFSIRATWAVPDHSQPGDTFTMELPDTLLPVNANFDLKNAAGAVVAKAVQTGNTVTVTLTDYVAGNPLDVRGTLSFGIHVSSDATAEETINVTWGQTSWSVTPKGAYVAGRIDTPSKFAWGDSGWTIQIPGPMAAGAKVTDELDGADMVCDSITGLVGDQSEGYPSSMDGFGLTTVSCDDDGFVVTTDRAVAANELLEIRYYANNEPGRKVVNNRYTIESSQWNTTDTVQREIVAGGDGDGENTPTPTPTDEPTKPEPTDEPTTPTEEPTTPTPTDEPTTPTEEPTTPTPTDEPTTPTEEPTTPTPTDEPTTPTEEPTTPTDEPTTPEPTDEPTTPTPTDETTTPTDEPTTPTEEPSTPSTPATTDGSTPPVVADTPTSSVVPATSDTTTTTGSVAPVAGGDESPEAGAPAAEVGGAGDSAPRGASVHTGGTAASVLPLIAGGGLVALGIVALSVLAVRRIRQS